MSKVNLFFKRVFDILFSFIGIILLSPIMLVIGIIVKITSRGKVVFRQERVGKGGKLFKILKYRTMISGADKMGLRITVGKDKRITKVGKFLRKFKLDEMPQLFNILIGQMSFVGPRPEVPEYVELYDETQLEILRIKPGMTDYASICFRNESYILAKSNNPREEYINNIMPLKIKYNMKYIKEMNLITDIKILFLTVWAVAGGKVEIDI